VDLVRFIDVLAADGWVREPNHGDRRQWDKRGIISIKPKLVTLCVPPGRQKHEVRFPLDKSWLEEAMKREFRLSFPVWDLKETPVKYPFVRSTVRPEDIYYDFEIHGANDYIYHCSEVVDPFQSTACVCGADLKYRPERDEAIFYASRLARVCDECGRDFDPTDMDAGWRDGWTGKELPPLKGGTTYRFAVVIYCGKCFPDRDCKVDIRPELMELCENHFGVPFYDVEDFY
jgi:hypothetical protein